FEKASRLLASIMSGEAASPDLKNVPQTELIERYLDEVNRLRTDYNQSNFAELAKALDSAYDVSRISFMESAAVDMDKLKEAIAGIHNNSFAKEPVKRISSELQTLLLSRYLLASNIADTVETGRNNLRLLVEKGEIFPVEAAVSYLLSYDRSSEE